MFPYSSFSFLLFVGIDSAEAVSSLINALYIEGSVNFIHAYLLLLEGFVDFKNVDFLLRMCSATSYFLSRKVMLLTTALKDPEGTNQNAKNSLQFIRRMFSAVSELIFAKDEDKETDNLLGNNPCFYKWAHL